MEDTRTHGAESAIDDTIAVAPNMTATADAHQGFVMGDKPIPGLEDLPGDIGDSPHGDMSLEYTLQNFNALVSANAAMQTELSAGAAREAELQDQMAHLREVFAESLKPTIAALTKVTDDQEKLIRKRDEQLERRDADVAFATAQRDTLQRRLDRSLGYLDRVLDDEEGHRAPDTRTVAAPKPPVGPALGEIPDAVRRNARGETDMPFATLRAGESIHFDDGTSARRRRY